MSAPALINRYAHVMIHSAAARGFDYNPLFRDIGLTAGSRIDDYEFNAERLAYIAREVKLLMQDEFCGFTRSRCKIGTFQLMCELALSGHTLGDALDKAFRLYEVFSEDIRFTLLDQEPVASIQVDLTHPQMDTEHFLNEWWMLIWRGFSSWLIGERIPVLSAQFPHAPQGPVDDYAQVFARACQFHQDSARLNFDRSLLERPIIRNPDDLKLFLAPARVDLISVPGIERTLTARIKNRMKLQFSETQNFPSMEEVAGQYHMCSQTLRRRLEEENSSYRLIKEEIRREVVMKWLSNLTIPIGEVSRMGGFAESNGLTRAVKSWIGMCPTEYRSSIAQAQH